MPLVGDPILAADFPSGAYAADDTTQLNLSNIDYEPGSPAVEALFIAPTSGQILLSVGLSARDNSGTNRVHLSPEIRLGNSAGPVVLSASVTGRGVGTPGGIENYVYRSRTTVVGGLTPGATYYVRTLQKVSGGSTADINVRDLTVTPLPLGSGRAGELVKALDYPPAVWAQDTTTITNPSNNSYTAGSPQVGVTFTAPTSGRVLLIVGGGVGQNAGNRIFLSPEVRVGSASGAVVLTPSVTNRGFSSDNVAVGFHYGSRESVLEGLTPGVVYYARVMYAVATSDGAGNNADISCREIGVVPLP